MSNLENSSSPIVSIDAMTDDIYKKTESMSNHLNSKGYTPSFFYTSRCGDKKFYTSSHFSNGIYTIKCGTVISQLKSGRSLTFNYSVDL